MNNNILSDCTLCPRDCHVNRAQGQTGYCRATSKIIVARASLHMWEEPCISGQNGSGTVFFSGCALGCVYCQNYKISSKLSGKVLTAKELSDVFLNLQNQGAHNINLVTPSHFAPQIVEAITEARKSGLNLPVVYNSSGYEKAETIRLLEGYVDVYLPDFKYFSNEIAKKYSNSDDYFYYASSALAEMVRQTGEPCFDENGIMTKGVIVRHLSLPQCLTDSKNVIKYLYTTFSDSIFISIMNQYTPLDNAKKYPELCRKITDKEYDELVDFAVSLGVEKGFIQEGETASESFIPDFDETGL